MRTSRHIHVDFIYRLIPRGAGRVLSTLVDVVRILFFGYAAVLTWQMMEKMSSYRMTIVDLPMNLVYGICMFGTPRIGTSMEPVIAAVPGTEAVLVRTSR